MNPPQLLREPLTHFFALAALLFAVNEIAVSSQKTRIVIDQQTIDYLVQQREELELRVLSEAERADTIDAFIEDEILYNEAYARGLDRGDSRMRRNMILKMRGLLTGDIDQPTEEELRRYFEANRERFSRPATVDVQQVYFDDPAAVPDDLLAQLEAGVDPGGLGVESVSYPPEMPGMSRRFIAEAFEPEVARVVVAIEDGDWHGPLRSAAGVHFVRITGRRPGIAASYESVASYLEGDWLMDQARKAIRNEIDQLRAGYEIVIETDS